MGVLRRFVGLGGVLASTCGAVLALHRLGELPWLQVRWGDLSGWLGTVPAEDAVMAALRLVALAAAYWLLATTTVYVLARASRLPAAVAAVQWATLPALRRLADRAVAVALTGSAALVAPSGVALAAMGDAGIIAPPAVTSPAALPADPPAAPSAPAGLEAPPDPPPPPPPDPPPAADLAPPGAPAVRIVAPGDNLWAIAAAQAGEDASLVEIHAYWQALVEANRERLRSGDPDLIHPGERLVLPPRD